MAGGKKVDTGGGAFVGGDVNTGGGRFVGRDDYSVTGASMAEAAQLFEQIYAKIEARPGAQPDEQADLQAEVQDVEKEMAKGEAADETFLSRRLRNIQRMAPDIWEVVVDTFANPVNGVGTAVRKVMAKAKAAAS